MQVPALERVFAFGKCNGAEIAKEYAAQGKNVILSSRSVQKLESVRAEMVKESGRDQSCFPILAVDIEKDESFKDIVSVAFLFCVFISRLP